MIKLLIPIMLMACAALALSTKDSILIIGAQVHMGLEEV